MPVSQCNKIDSLCVCVLTHTRRYPWTTSFMRPSPLPPLPFLIRFLCFHSPCTLLVLCALRTQVEIICYSFSLAIYFALHFFPRAVFLPNFTHTHMSANHQRVKEEGKDLNDLFCFISPTLALVRYFILIFSEIYSLSTFLFSPNSPLNLLCCILYFDVVSEAGDLSPSLLPPLSLSRPSGGPNWTNF